MIRVSISDSTPIRVTVTEEMVIRVTAFDYPPEIDTLNGRVDAVETSITGITQLVQEATMAATEAAESAEEASTAATEAIAVANSATETATNANQAIIQHTDSTTNPHDITTSQEFAEVIVTGLKSSSNGGDVPDDDYNWFKSLYASLVDGSVKSWIMGLVNQLKALFDRTDELEWRAFGQRYELPVDHMVSGEYISTSIAGGTASQAIPPLANALVLSPLMVSSDINVQSITVRVATAASGGRMYLAIYEGNPFYPLNQIWVSDEITHDTTGAKVATCNVVLRKGKIYWFGYVTDNTTVRLYMLTVSVMPQITAPDISTTVGMSNTCVRINYNYASPPLSLNGYTIYVSVLNNVLATFQKA